MYAGTAYGNLTWKPVHHLTVQAKATAEGSRKWFLPAYSLGAEYRIHDDLAVLRLSTAYNVHAPTLNDLYWNPGGNPALQPEKGFSQEAGVRVRSHRGCFWYTVELTGYYSDIRNWIVWQPVSGSYIWTPRNLQRVRSYGVEAEGSISCVTGSWVNRLQFGYGYTPSVNRTRHGDKDATVNRQLPYIPRHKGHLHYRLEVKGFAFHYGISYTGKRYTTTDESYYTPAYWLHNASLSWRIGWRNECAVEIRFVADNLLNVYYESTKSYPMPLRNFSGSLLFSF